LVEDLISISSYGTFLRCPVIKVKSDNCWTLVSFSEKLQGMASHEYDKVRKCVEEIKAQKLYTRRGIRLPYPPLSHSQWEWVGLGYPAKGAEG